MYLFIPTNNYKFIYFNDDYRIIFDFPEFLYLLGATETEGEEIVNQITYKKKLYFVCRLCDQRKALNALQKRIKLTTLCIYVFCLQSFTHVLTPPTKNFHELSGQSNIFYSETGYTLYFSNTRNITRIKD